MSKSAGASLEEKIYLQDNVRSMQVAVELTQTVNLHMEEEVAGWIIAMEGTAKWVEQA